MNSKLNYIYFFDLYSKRAGFFYNNNEKIGSIFGLLLTFIYIAFSLFLAINYLILTIQRNEVKVYDTSLHAQEMPFIKIDSDNLYFAFGVEDPVSMLRYIDETIYYPRVLFIERVKVDGIFETITKKYLDYERCKEEKFGKYYQHFFITGELNNSYCLKDFDENLILEGGYKYEKMSYIRILIYPCKNTTDNNNHCKPRETIDYYMTSGYFSLLIKNFGLDPSNYYTPIVPMLQDVYTTLDRRLLRNIYVRFAITEIHTDVSIWNENIKKEKYLQYKDNFQNFHFREEKDYLAGKMLCAAHLELDDSIVIQRRTYTKISEVFSKMGGYMQLMNTVFSLITFLTNKFQTEIKLLNSIFQFNIKEKKIGLKFKYLDHKSVNHLSLNHNLVFCSRKSSKNIELNNNKSKNQLITKENSSIMSSILKASYNNKKANPNITNLIKDNIPKNANNINNAESSVNIIRALNSKECFSKKNSIINNNDKQIKINNTLAFKENIKLNICDVLCSAKNSKKRKDIELFRLGNSFYKKNMDIVHFFNLLTITEKVLIKDNEKIMIYCT